MASTTRSRGAPGEPWELVIWSESELWADALEVSYDWIRVAGQGGFGRIVPGPTWTGGNVFVDDSTDPPAWTAVGADIVVSSDEPGRVLRVHAAGPPEPALESRRLGHHRALHAPDARQPDRSG